jgi:histone H2A
MDKRFKRPRQSKSKRAGLMFPVGRVAKYLRKGRYAKRITASAPVYLAAVLEFVCSELMEEAGRMACKDNRVRISPRHLFLGVKFDEELNRLLLLRSTHTIAESGVVEYIHPHVTGRYWMPRT